MFSACSSLAESRTYLEENYAVEENVTLATPQNDLATETAMNGDSFLPTLTPRTLGEDCTLTTDDTSTFPSDSSPEGAPVAPNQTLLIATGHCVWQVQASSLNIKPEMLIFIAEIEIIEAKDVEGFINNLTGQEGQTIKIFSKTPIPPDAPGRTIEALVTFKGDEHGGKYWVINDQLSIR